MIELTIREFTRSSPSEKWWWDFEQTTESRMAMSYAVAVFGDPDNQLLRAVELRLNNTDFRFEIIAEEEVEE
jgi:hypothetical protein